MSVDHGEVVPVGSGDSKELSMQVFSLLLTLVLGEAGRVIREKNRKSV
jgi:hypothetical protein